MKRRQARKTVTRRVGARNALAMKHTKLVHSIAKRYRTPGIDYEGVVQEGHIGLLEAAKRYKPKKGKFSTYATPWIRKHVHAAVRSGFTVRLPERRLKSATRPSIVPLEAAERYGTGGGIGRAHARASLSRLKKRLGSLSAQQQKVMRLRYFSGKPMTARQVAKKLKITPGRISQLERAARKRWGG